MSNCKKCSVYNPQLLKNETRIAGFGNKSPKAVILSLYPESYNNESKYFPLDTYKLISDITNSKPEDSFYLTTLVKCIPYTDPFIKENGYRNPVSREINICIKYLFQELSTLPDDTPIVLIGNSLCEVFITQDDFSLSKSYNRTFDINILDKKFTALVAVNPKSINYNPFNKTLFRKVIQRVFSDNRASDDNWKILNPSDGLDYLSDLRSKYLNKEFDHTMYDLETSSLKYWNGEILGSCWRNPNEDFGVFIPYYVTNHCHHEDYPFKDQIVEIPWEVSQSEYVKLRNQVKEVLHTIPIIGHNLKFDVKFSVYHGFANIDKIKIHDDTQLTAFLVYSRQFGESLKLKDLCVNLLNLDANWELPINEYKNRFRLIKDRTYKNIPTSILGRYGALDAYYNEELFKILNSKIIPDMSLIRDILRMAVTQFAETELKGIKIDNNMYEFLKVAYGDMLSKYRKKMRDLPMVAKFVEKRLKLRIDENDKRKKPKKLDLDKERDLCFSPTSTTDIPEILYGKDYYALPILVKTEKGKPAANKTAVKALGALEKDEVKDPSYMDFLNSFIDYKRFSKLKSTYIDNLPRTVVEGTYRPEYNLTGAITGRLSSGFHTLPKKSDIKRMYTSRWSKEGGLVLIADFSQLELRIISSLSNEKTWIEAYKNGIDIHKATGSTIYKIPVDQVTSDQRTTGKTINFGIIYGKTAKSLAIDLKISQEESNNIINSLLAGASNLNRWIENQHNFVRREGFIVTAFNRVIPIPEGKSRNKWLILEAERRSVNYPVQSSASDLGLYSIIRVNKEIKLRNMKSIFLGTVHDSMLFDVYPGELPALATIIKYQCQDKNAELFGDNWLKCPIVIDIGIGTSWGSVIDIDFDHYDKNKLIASGSSISKNFKLLNSIGSNAYNINYNILERKELSGKDFTNDVLVKDREKWEVNLAIENK